MTREEKKQELIALFTTGAMPIGELIDDCFAFADVNPHWISVEDELPPKEKNVLIWSSGSKEVMIGYYIGRNWQRKTNDFYSYVDDGYWHNITHWMHLPQSPKKGGEQ